MSRHITELMFEEGCLGSYVPMHGESPLHICRKTGRECIEDVEGDHCEHAKGIDPDRASELARDVEVEFMGATGGESGPDHDPTQAL